MRPPEVADRNGQKSDTHPIWGAEIGHPSNLENRVDCLVGASVASSSSRPSGNHRRERLPLALCRCWETGCKTVVIRMLLSQQVIAAVGRGTFGGLVVAILTVLSLAAQFSPRQGRFEESWPPVEWSEVVLQ